MASFRKSVFSDVEYLADNLRDADEKELKASSGLEPLEALSLSFQISHECNTIVTDEGTVVGIFGLARINDTMGCPWLMGTDLIKDIRSEFLRGSKDWIIEKNKEYQVLTNFVHAENTTAIRWLKYLGFSFPRLVEEYGVGKEPFYEFVRINTNV
jgi:hypothetical protein